MKRTTLFFISLFTGLLLLNSCKSGNRFSIDTTQNRIQVKIHRFDKDLLSLDTSKIKAGVNSLYSHYPAFLPVYTSEVLDTAASDTAAIRKLFVQFLSDSTFSSVNKKTLETFGDVSDIEKTVSDAFTYIHHYFPEVKLPDVYFFVSGFNRQVIMDNTFIAIGTDFYLGNDFPGYKDLTYKYMLYNMRRECVSTDLVSATLFRMFIMNTQENRLLDNMIYRGRIMYLLSVFMPEEKPENLIGYTGEQWKWCNTYQKEIWAAIIDQKDLFSTDLTLIGKYMNDAPFTAPVSQDSPGRLGTWIGWQIVKSYMTKNSNISLRELMDENNYQKILENSGYRP